MINIKNSIILSCALFFTVHIHAQESTQDIANQLANPVASLISVPMQGNWEFGVGPNEDTRWILNVQPVIPVSISKNWNVIGRIIVPLVSQPALTTDGNPAFGVGDIVTSAFFSPKAPKKLIWGIGPVLLLPVSSDPMIGSEQWGAGPTIVLLKQFGGFTVGMLANHLVSFAGDDARSDVNTTFLQPFFAYATKKGTTISLNTETSANWEAADGQQWTVPINAQVAKVVKAGRLPIQLFAGAGYFAAKPDVVGANWKFRAGLTMLFPKPKQ